MTAVPPTLEFTVDRDLHGIRIDTFLSYHLRNYTRWRLARIVRAGGTKIDFGPVDETRRVARGERVQVTLFEPPDKLLLPQPIELPLVYSDNWILVIDKPAGLIAHPTGEYQTGTLINALQHILNAQTALPGLLRPGVVHRLDRQTSGLMVVAAQHRSHMLLSAAFEQGRVSKTYLALVEGTVSEDHGSIDLPIGRTRYGRGILMSARADAVDRKPACTRFRVIERYPQHTLVEARPQTGRNHQIRVHFAHIGHPLVGDEFYLARGAIRSERSAIRARRSGLEAEIGGVLAEEEDDDSLGRHMLHAARLEFAHPISDLWMTFTAPLPQDFCERIAAVSS
ncbi:MAG: RluA family pseudouridine synthase [Planctomycetaceae bacterium]|nr:RluA family pseudouridine synthase [Planctomycetaceae bacterium]